MEHWVVSSYGYPNPFSEERYASDTWEMLESFFDFEDYHDLKKYWEDGPSPRTLSSNSVESRKAAFEEFGLLYVPRGSGQIVKTPAGEQFVDAVAKKDHERLACIGLSLLLRYPLRGVPASARSSSKGGPLQQKSDLLLYWFLYAALHDLDGRLWRCEIDYIFSKAFTVKEAREAVAFVKAVRDGRESLSETDLPDNPKKGQFYNMMNQSVVHASMYYDLLNKPQKEYFCDHESLNYCYSVREDFAVMVRKALGASTSGTDCGGATGSFMDRMPAAPLHHETEEGYFDYLGAEVPSISEDTPVIETVDLDTESVAILKENTHYTRGDGMAIEGRIGQLCTLSEGQRVIVSHDMGRSRIVERKERTEHGHISVRLRKARFINKSEIEKLYRDQRDD